MKGYTQLTQEQRYQIEALCGAGLTQSEMAVLVGVHESTISRELGRNRSGFSYRAGHADQLAKARRKGRSGGKTIPAATWERVRKLIRQDWSPEQISGYLKREHIFISHETIYQFIYADKRAGGNLHKHLRCQKQRRKRYGGQDRRGQLRNRRSIEERPAIVEKRVRLGDWEVDTIIGRGHSMGLVSLIDRKSRLVLLQKVQRTTAVATQRAIVNMLTSLKGADGQTHQVRTITADNGREFASHEEIARALSADFFFAHPYSSWERGANENANGLVRQYFPKGSCFSKLNSKQVKRVADRLNHRPRKSLGFRTPYEVFLKHTKVALRG